MPEDDPDNGGRREDPPEGSPGIDPADHDFVLPIEDALDLHPFAPREIPDVVASYLDAAQEKGFREVRLIHGRGIGVQRERVRALLARHPEVEGFGDAPAPRGGWGATVVRLRRRGNEEPPGGSCREK